MNWPELLKSLAENRHWLPSQVLDGMTVGQFWILHLPTSGRRQTSPERLRELRNQQRLKAGKRPL